MFDPVETAGAIVEDEIEKRKLGAEIAARVKAVLAPEQIKAALAAPNVTLAFLDALSKAER